MLTKAALIVFSLIITFSALALLCPLLMYSNPYVNTFNDCLKVKLGCRMNCFGNALGFIDSSGSINITAAPFGNVIKDLNILDGCETKTLGSFDECEKAHDTTDCLLIRFFSFLGDVSKKCARDSAVEDIRTDKDGILNSFRDPARGCYNLCLAKSLGAVDDAGNLHVKRLFKNVLLFNDDDLEGNVKECATASFDDDECQRFSKRALCSAGKLADKFGLPSLTRMKYLIRQDYS